MLSAFTKRHPDFVPIAGLITAIICIVFLAVITFGWFPVH
jgi:hypothetical protein